jgi:hypothetical protein
VLFVDKKSNIVHCVFTMKHETECTPLEPIRDDEFGAMVPTKWQDCPEATTEELDRLESRILTAPHVDMTVFDSPDRLTPLKGDIIAHVAVNKLYFAHLSTSGYAIYAVELPASFLAEFPRFAASKPLPIITDVSARPILKRISSLSVPDKARIFDRLTISGCHRADRRFFDAVAKAMDADAERIRA